MPSLIADDYYALLGVREGADGEELRKAWRQLVLRWHPDLAGEGATATFQQLSAAYTVLSDPVARAAYDRRRGADPPSAVAPSPAQAPSPPPRPARPTAPAVMLRRISGSLSSLMACGTARRDEDGVISLVIREDEAAQGGMATISMRVDVWCPDCAGPARSAPCGSCEGTRMVRELFSAWIAVPPGVTDGEDLAPSDGLPGMVAPVRFRVRIHRPT